MGIKYIFYINHHLKRWFKNRLHSMLRRADARGSADIIHHM